MIRSFKIVFANKLWTKLNISNPCLVLELQEVAECGQPDALAIVVESAEEDGLVLDSQMLGQDREKIGSQPLVAFFLVVVHSDEDNGKGRDRRVLNEISVFIVAMWIVNLFSHEMTGWHVHLQLDRISGLGWFEFYFCSTAHSSAGWVRMTFKPRHSPPPSKQCGCH